VTLFAPSKDRYLSALRIVVFLWRAPMAHDRRNHQLDVFNRLKQLATVPAFSDTRHRPGLRQTVRVLGDLLRDLLTSSNVPALGGLDVLNAQSCDRSL
jgi:hypothetical protein